MEFLPLLMFPLIIFGIVTIIIGASKQSKASRETWRRFAQHMGMRGGPWKWTELPRIVGVVDGLRCEVEVIRVGSSKNQQIYTVYSASFNGQVPAGLQLYQETFFSKVGKAFGGQDI